MARSFFALFPGIMAPQQFQVHGAPELLTISDLWGHARQCPPSLLFRVRSESDADSPVGPNDRLESCVGVVDAVVRWRAIFNMTRSMLNAVRNPALRGVLGQAMQFVSTQHPAAVTQEQRNALIGEIGRLAETPPEDQPAPTDFEKIVAAYIARIVSSDSDVEASYNVPFLHALCPFDQQKQGEEWQGRMATLETTSGAVLITEAANRLGERMPQWIGSGMPPITIVEPQAPPRRDRDED